MAGQPGEKDSNVAISVFKDGKNIGIKHRGVFVPHGSQGIKRENETFVTYNGPAKKTDVPAQPQQPQRGKHRVDSYEVAPQTRKLPPSNLDVDQRIATAGESLPIVFGKRQSFFGGLFVIGGVWVAPSMIRSACEGVFDNPALNPKLFNEGTGRFAYGSVFAVSQGQLVGTPSFGNVFIGQQRIQAVAQGDVYSVAKEYKSASFMEANPNFCPIPIANVSCGDSNRSWYAGQLTNNSIDVRSRGTDTVAFAVNYLFRATGALNNTIVEWDVKYIDALTNEQLNAGIITGFAFPDGDRYLRTGETSAFWTNYTDAGASGSYIIRLQLNFIDYQWDPLKPADTNTITSIDLAGFQSDSYTPTIEVVDTRGYADITIVGIDADVFSEGTQQKQAYMYFDQGTTVTLYSQGPSGGNYATGASNKFVDLAFYLFSQYKAIAPTASALYGSIIDDTDCSLLSSFNEQYYMLCNGVIDVSVNIIDWISEAANYFLLAFINVDGKYRFAPLLPLTPGGLIDTGVLSATFEFNEATIIEGSYSKQYIPPYDRTDFVASLVYREMSDRAVSAQKTLEFFYEGTPLDAPREQYDLTDTCTDPFHVTYFGAYQLSKRRHVTHSISFETFLPDQKLIPTDIISVTMNRLTTAGDDRSETNFYQITGMTFAQDGRVRIDALEFPLNSSGQSVISLEVDGLTPFDLIF